jgi:hypothetical protein
MEVTRLTRLNSGLGLSTRNEGGGNPVPDLHNRIVGSGKQEMKDGSHE